MPIISTIGRRSPQVRLLLATIYASLLLGSLSMLYPFALMIAGSTKSAVDLADPHLLPAYLRDDGALYRKHIEARFNESLEMMRLTYGSQAPSFAQLDVPAAANPRLAAVWKEFCRTADLPAYAYMIGDIQAPRSRGVLPSRLRQFKRRLSRRFAGDLGAMNQAMGSEFVSWNSFFLPAEEYLLRRNLPGTLPLNQEFNAFKAEQPIAARYYFLPEGYYRSVYLQSKYGREIADYNAAVGAHHADWGQVRLDRRLPDGPGRSEIERADWLAFVRTILNLLWLRADPAATPHYQAFLAAKYGEVAQLNHRYATAHESFAAVPLPEIPPSGLPWSDWAAFVEGWQDPDTGILHQLPADCLRLHGVEFQFRDWLAGRYPDVEAANRDLGADWGTWADAWPPQQDSHYLDFRQRRGASRWEFTARNFITVVDYLVLHGRGLRNTVIYCLLAISAALVVNPLAAYALSRYRPPSQYKILLFMMLTMAFPPIVTMIPAFLLLREFGLLNSFWALVLPSLANGYSIFLLKGFFDSLPRELYESAAIDGASEIRIFLQITMSLSKPILAVIALNAFNAAYGNFMMALLICQDEQMWTIMPWLFQLQQRSGEGVVFASLLIAAIPTFLIFAFCQNIIMRGIVVPVEK